MVYACIIHPGVNPVLFVINLKKIDLCCEVLLQLQLQA